MIKRVRRRLASLLYAIALEEPDEYRRRQIRRMAGGMVPNRWTQEQIDDIRRRAQETKRELDALTD